jgi:hypothetical protein
MPWYRRQHDAREALSAGPIIPHAKPCIRVGPHLPDSSRFHLGAHSTGRAALEGRWGFFTLPRAAPDYEYQFNRLLDSLGKEWKAAIYRSFPGRSCEPPSLSAICGCTTKGLRAETRLSE